MIHLRALKNDKDNVRQEFRTTENLKVYLYRIVFRKSPFIYGI